MGVGVTGNELYPVDAAWRTLALTAPWVAYGSGHPAPAFRMTEGGMIVFRGLAQNAVNVTQLNIGQLPTGYTTGVPQLYVVRCSTNGTEQNARLDIGSTGLVTFTTNGLTLGSTIQWVSFAGVMVNM